MMQQAAGVIVTLLWTCTALAETSVTAYEGATLIDGTGSPSIANATVLVREERIVAVGPDVEIPEDALRINVADKWIVPGLIDAHIHFMTSGRSYTRPAFIDLTDKVPYEEEIAFIKGTIAATLKAHMCSGVTSVLSLGGPSLEYSARELAQSMDHAPTVFIGHGVLAHTPQFIAERMIPPWDGELTVKPVMSVEDAAAHVSDAVANGADLIKTAVDDRGSTFLRLMLWGSDWEEVEAAVIAEAAKQGLRVTTHAHALKYARKMMELGAASLQHIPADAPVDDAFIALAKSNGVVIAPTLAIGHRTFVSLYTKALNLTPAEAACAVPGVVESWQEPLEPLDADVDAYWRDRTAMASANAKALYEGGVDLAVGTDAGMIGIAHGGSFHLEIRSLHEAGIPADYLIKAATLNSARVAGKEDSYGSVEAGKFADFLILDANPLEDIANLQRIHQVVKHGKAFDQAELLPGG